MLINSLQQETKQTIIDLVKKLPTLYSN